MATSILAQAVVDKSSGGDSSYTHGAFAVPGGTTRLLVQVEYRGFADAAAPALTSVTHNGDAVSFLAGSATTGGFDDITTWWGQLANPDIGTFNIVVTFPSDVRGVKLWILALSGEKSSGSILGQSSFQRKAGAVTDTVGLGITPAASGDSLLLGSLAIAQSTTLTTWTGTGWTAVATDTYTGGGNLTSTSRHLLNAPGGAALTVSAKFGATDTDIGGSLIEILAEPVGTDVSDTFGVTLAMAGSVAGGSSAALTDASFRRLAAWTEVLAIQPDLAGVDRRILAAGPATAPNLVVDQIASGSVYRWRYRLTDGDVTVDSAVGTQSVAAQHIALVHGGEGGPAMYLNGVQSIGAIAGSDLTGITDIGAGGETIGSHATGTAYTGLIGRYLLADSALSAEQVRLLALSQTDPDAIWGVGVEDDAQVANQSPVVLPMVVEPDGRPQITVRPTIIDPNGTGAVLSSVTLPTHGSVVIADKDLVINLEPGWVGRDSFTVTASDGSKTSTAKITIVQTRPALLVQGDSITLTESSSTTFDPRSNDIGAGEQIHDARLVDRAVRLLRSLEGAVAGGTEIGCHFLQPGRRSVRAPALGVGDLLAIAGGDTRVKHELSEIVVAEAGRGELALDPLIQLAGVALDGRHAVEVVFQRGEHAGGLRRAEPAERAGLDRAVLPIEEEPHRVADLAPVQT